MTDKNPTLGSTATRINFWMHRSDDFRLGEFYLLKSEKRLQRLSATKMVGSLTPESLTFQHPKRHYFSNSTLPHIA